MYSQPPPDKEYEIEAQFVSDCLAHFGAKPWCWVWRENTGRGFGLAVVRTAIQLLEKGRLREALVALKSCRPIVFGIPGRADISGILCRGVGRPGRPFAIEAKVKKRKRHEDQVRWADNFIRFGGVYVLAEQISDVYDVLIKEGYGDLL